MAWQPGEKPNNNNKNTNNSCSRESDFEIPTSFGWVIRVCILHWGLVFLLYFLFYLLCLLFFCDGDGDDGVSCYCQHFSSHPPPSPLHLPRLPPWIVWLMAGSDDEIRRQQSRHWNYKYNMCTYAWHKRSEGGMNSSRNIHIYVFLSSTGYKWFWELLNGQ